MLLLARWWRLAYCGGGGTPLLAPRAVAHTLAWSHVARPEWRRVAAFLATILLLLDPLTGPGAWEVVAPSTHLLAGKKYFHKGQEFTSTALEGMVHNMAK